jgi:CRP-like cAMP-binding protein
MAENNPALHENPSVAAIRGRTMAESAMRPIDDGLSRPRKPSDGYRRAQPEIPPNIAVGRSKSRPIALPLGAALDTVDLKTEVPSSHSREDEPGIHVIPIDEEFDQDTTLNTQRQPIPASGPPVWEIDASEEEVSPEISESTELDLSDIEEIPLPRPRVIGAAAARALAATPLFAGMPSDALQALVANLQLMSLEPGEALFHAGDRSDALYVIVEGELSVQSPGPPATELSRLGPGAFLGEVALMTDQPRAATVICLSPAELLRIDRHTLSRVLANHGDVLRAVLRFVRDRLVDRWMRTSPLFRPFNDAQRIELAGKFKFLEIDAGTVVLGTGERPDGLYIVLAGQFLVLRNGSAVAELGPGDLIGETALLSGGVFKSDVVARGKGLALCLPAAVFREVIMTHPHVLEYIGEQAEHSRRLQIL